MILQEKIDRVNPKKLYRPKEIAEMNLFFEGNKNSHFYILRAIRRGVLRASNASMSVKKPFYLIRGSDIITLLKTLNKD